MSAVCLFVLIGYLGAATYGDILYLTHQNEVAFVTLDVCHTGSSAIYGNTDMPLLCAWHFTPTAPGLCCFSVMKDPAFNPLLVVFEKDRPPQS